MPKYIIISLVWLTLLPAKAYDRPSVLELLDKYAETQDKLKSFILKCEDSWEMKPSEVPGVIKHYRESEVRFDGNRFSMHQHQWGGNLHSPYSVPKDDNRYLDELWDGKRWLTYVKTNRGADKDILTFNDASGDNTKDIFSGMYHGSPIRGFLPTDNQRIDLVLRKVDTISVRDEMDQVGKSKCYVIEAKTRGGKYKVWIDPEHGYNIAKVIVEKKSEAARRMGGRVQDDMSCSVRNIRFEKINDVWGPMEADIEMSHPWGNGRYRMKQHHKVTEIILNPDHDALGSFDSFVIDDIRNGALVHVAGIQEIDFRWQDGELIPDVDEFVINEIDRMANELLSERKAEAEPEAKLEPTPLTVLDLLDRYTATQSRLGSFIAKGESTIEYTGTAGQTGRTEKVICEFRFGGNRVNHRSSFWDGLLATKDKPAYKSFLWDGKNFYKYRQGRELKDNTVFIKKNDLSKKRLIATEYKGAPLMGICAGDYERVDSILRKADTISLRDKPEQIGDSNCFVIDAVTNCGKYTVWLDPDHGYNIAKVQVQRNKGDLVYDGQRVETTMSFLLDSVRFQKIDDVWVPMEAGVEYTDNKSRTARWHHKRTQMILNSDFDALKAFVPDDIPDGTKVLLASDWGQYKWHSGKVVTEDGSDVKF